MLDILITHAFVISMQGEGVGLIEDGAVGIRGNRIEVVGSSDQIIKSFEAHRVIDATGMALMPGLIDAHIHTSVSLLRGISQDIDDWMVAGLWPFETKLRQHTEFSVIGTKLNLIEAVKCGTTTFCDFDSPMDKLVQCHYEIGTRARVAELISGLPRDNSGVEASKEFPLSEEIEKIKLDRNLRLISDWNGADGGRITCLFGPQAADMVSVTTLNKIKQLSNKLGVGIHMHVSQSVHENTFTQKKYGMRAIPFLESIDYLDEQLIAVHLIDATPEEVHLLAQKGASMVACNTGDVLITGLLPPSAEFLQVSNKLALGSDEATGNNCNNMFNEMKFTSLLNKMKAASPSVFPAWKVMRMATIEGAKAIGLGDEIGSLECGKKADMILINLNIPNLSPVITEPVRNIVPNIVYSARGDEVQTVIIDGKIIMEDRIIKTVDEHQVLMAAKAAAKQVCREAKPEFDRRKTALYSMMRNDKL